MSGPWNVKTITTQTTTVIKADSGVLGKLVIPTPVAAATVKIYDGAAATGRVLVETITMPGTLLSSGPVSLDLNAYFVTNLTVVTAGANMGINVYYI